MAKAVMVLVLLWWASVGPSGAAMSPEVVGRRSGAGQVPWSEWKRLSGGRGGRSSLCGAPCVCVSEGGGEGVSVLVVDCSMALEPRAVTEGFRATPPPVPALQSVEDDGGGDSDIVVRLVVMSSELPALEDDSFGNVSFTHAHIKYNHGLSHVSPFALRASRATLRVLDLRNNNLTAFPLAEHLNSFLNLQFLSIDDNDVEHVPEGVAELAQLLHLSLANNRVADLHPHALTQLPSLLHLDLHSNRLQALPAQLSALPALRSLLLWDNPLTTLNAGFLGGFHSLEYLDLSYTGIKDIEATALTTPTTAPWLLNLRRTPITQITSSAFLNGSLPHWMDLRETGVRSLDQSFQVILQHMSSKNIVHIDWGKPQLWIHNEVLACDCSMKWLVTNSTLLKHITGRCNDKNINLRFLDPDYFNIFCF